MYLPKLFGDDYNISDIAVQAWYGNVVLGNAYDAAAAAAAEYVRGATVGLHLLASWGALP